MEESSLGSGSRVYFDALHRLILHRFWVLAIRTASPGSQERFLKSYYQYTQAVVQEALDRQEGVIYSVDDYFLLRRETIGAKPAFAILELNLCLSQEVLDHPVVKEMEILCVDMIILSNVREHNRASFGIDSRTASCRIL